MATVNALPFSQPETDKVFEELRLEQCLGETTLKEARDLTATLKEILIGENVSFDYPALKAFLSHVVSCVTRAHKGEPLPDVDRLIEKEVGEKLIDSVLAAMKPWYESIGVSIARSEAVLVATHIAAAKVGGC